MKNDGGPAFPCKTVEMVVTERGATTEIFEEKRSHGGMSLRDYATLKVLQGFCANPAIFAPNGNTGWGLVNCTEDDLIGYARDIADRMLKARES